MELKIGCEADQSEEFVLLDTAGLSYFCLKMWKILQKRLGGCTVDQHPKNAIKIQKVYTFFKIFNKRLSMVSRPIGKPSKKRNNILQFLLTI